MKLTDSELAWDLAEYCRREVEPPPRIFDQPQSCEGVLMTEAEIEQFIRDGMAAVLVMHDQALSRAAEVQAIFFNDLAYLVSIGRLAPDDYTMIIDRDNYSF
jgi:hypothetical protein